MTVTGDGSRDCCKVGRVSRQYGLTGSDEFVRSRHASGASLRDLADEFNERVLEQTLADASIDILEDPTTVYEILTDGETDPGRQAQLRSRLSRAGVDLEAVTDDFVTHETMRSHLRDCLDIDTSRGSAPTATDARNTAEWLRSRTEAVVDDKLQRLRKHDRLDTGPLETTVTTRVTCTACGRTYHLSTLLDRGVCDCGEFEGVAAEASET